MSNASRRYPDRPLVGVGAVVLVNAAQGLSGIPASVPEPHGFVLVKRRHEPMKGRWSLPGGMLAAGETLASGVAREVLEETGLLVDVGAVVDVLDRIDHDDEGRVLYHYVLIDYLCRASGGALRAGSDATEVSIADPRALARFDLAPTVERVVSRAMQMAW